jgi:hypothetical protein
MSNIFFGLFSYISNFFAYVMGTIPKEKWGKQEAHHITVNEVLKRAKTGDVILFQGQGLSGGLIRFMSICNRFSHVGLVVVDKEKKLITEAYNEIISDDYYRPNHEGVQFVDLEERIRTYPSGCVAYRPINCAVEQSEVDALSQNYKSLDDSEVPLYSTFLWDFFEYGTRTDDDDNVHKGRKYFVCTAWVAHLLMYFKVFNRKVEPGNYLLSDFALTHRPITTLNPKYNFGEVYYIIQA